MRTPPLTVPTALLALAWLLTPPLALAATPVPLATAPVQVQGGSAEAISLDAVVEAVRQTTLSAQVPGAIVALRVQVGDTVKAGQELLRIDARAAQQNVAGSAAQVDAAQAALNVAATEYERQKQLFEKQYISQGALDRAQAQYRAAQAQVNALQAQTRAAQTQSGFFVLNAPYAGVVSEVPVTLGDMAMPGRPLITLHDPSALRVTAAVPQTLLAGLRVGSNGSLQGLRYELPGLPDLKGPQAAQQVQLLPTVDAATHTAQLRVALPAQLKGAAPGMFARVWLPSAGPANAAAPRLFVPASAVLRRSEMTGVYVVDAQGNARLRQVRLGQVAGDRVEVLSGVNPGEAVATDPQAAARAR
jgi:RND family efflux transporter MFP subunit